MAIQCASEGDQWWCNGPSAGSYLRSNRRRPEGSISIVDEESSSRVWMKRRLLRAVAALFDPLGLLQSTSQAKFCCSAPGEQGWSGTSHRPRHWQDEFRRGGETHSNLEMLFVSPGGLERRKTQA